MKKLVLTTAILMGLVMGANAQHNLFQNKEKQQANSGIFSRNEDSRLQFEDFGYSFLMPKHGEDLNGDAGGPDAPLGGGALLLIGFGAAYAMSKRNKKD